MKFLTTVSTAALLNGLSASMLMAQFVEPTTPPAPPKFEAQTDPELVERSDIFEYRALDSYSEPAYVNEFVEAGKLPPVEERLPKEPLVYSSANMPDGPGVYGDAMRHVIGGRPEGWNYWAGQSQGWGGIDIGLYECLTRTGPLFTIKPEDLEPLPNLARSWEWSEDGKTLTIHLIEGAKWSDGDPFDTKDIEFYWNDIVMDPSVTPVVGTNPASFGDATLKVIDDYTFTMSFDTAFPETVLYALGYGNFCPGPSHVLKPEHPKYGGESYQSFRNAFPPEQLGFPVMGAWVPVKYASDDIIVMRRNPYYWKVDENGNQLPYLNELHYRLSTWADRDVQAIAGTGDFSNLEQPENYVEVLRKSAEEDAPARLAFAQRTIGYTLIPNLAANGTGEPNERAQAIRELNRNRDFRIGVSQALDRQRLGEALVKGPFTTPYAGGLMPGSFFYDDASTAFYPYSIESARAHFEAAGLKDTDGNGYYNFPEGVAGGGDVQLIITNTNDYQTDKNLGEAVLSMLGDAGIKVSLNSQSVNDRDGLRSAGKFDWILERNEGEYITVVQNTSRLAPLGKKSTWGHQANEAGEIELLPFEEELVDTLRTFLSTRDGEERLELMKSFQKLYTENAYTVGLTAYPGALIINKRFANVPKGAPIFMFNWAEGAIMRERVYVPDDKQQDYELFPDSLPTSEGPIKVDG